MRTDLIHPRRILHFLLLSGILLLTTACAHQPTVGLWAGPVLKTSVHEDAWTYGDTSGRILLTSHYRIFTTMHDQTPDSVAQVLEGAHNQYARATAAGSSTATKQLDVYLFLRRTEWTQFTKDNTGPYAPIYLRVQRGGYTIGDVAVAHYLGDLSTWHVMAHEGYHQHVARNFVGRLPPFIEEGTACLFESVRFENELPQWNLSVNPNRAAKLQEAMEEKTILSLDQLIRLHAGELVGKPAGQIDGFYAQNWAFVRFLREANGGRFRPAFLQIMADTASGKVYDPTGTLTSKDAPWNPDCVKPMLEHYLQLPLDQVDVLYQAYLKYLVDEEIRAQWAS